MTLLEFAASLVRPPAAPRVRQDTEDFRRCLYCGRTAWYEKTDEDGCRIYQCSTGHQIVERPKEPR